MKIISIFLLLLSLQVYAKPCKKISQVLLDLYPKQTEKIMGARIDNARNKHKFMRAFIPYYYQELFNAKFPIHNKLKNTTGVIVGDAHVENFGYMVNNEGKSILGLNDFDDVAEAPLYLDVMRLSQSASYVDDVDQAKLLDAYKKGLQNSDYTNSKYLKKLEEASIEGANKTKAHFEKSGEGFLFKKKNEPNFTTTTKEQTQLKKIISDKYGSKAIVYDTYRTIKESGGSAFKNRYHLLVKLDDEVQLIELKEIAPTGVESFAKTISENNRINHARNTFLGDNFDQKLDVVKIENSSYQLRFKSKGNQSIDFNEVPSKEVTKVIEDEFYLLGQLHRQSLGNSTSKVKTYLDELKAVTVKEWEETIGLMRKKIKAAFELAND